MKYTKKEIIDLTKEAAMIETYVFTSDNHRIHTDNIKYVGTGTFDNQEIDNLPYKNGEVDVDIRIMSKEDYEASVLVNSSENWPEDLNDNDKIAVIIVNEEEEDEDDEEPRKLYVLSNSIWSADDYLNDRNTDPLATDLYLFATRKEAVAKAQSLDVAHDIYNDCTLFTGEMDDEEILDITGYDSIEDFNEALAEPYSTDPNVKNYGEVEKTDVAKAIVEYPDEDEIIDAANYDFGKSLEGCILVFWSWQRYIGYARKCIEVRHANPEDTESMTTKQNKTFVTQCDILLTAKEVAEADDLQEAVREALSRPSWKWTNPNFVESQIENL